MKFILLGMFSLVLAISSTAQRRANPFRREKINLDADWKFSLTDTLGAEQPAFNDRGWRTVRLPHDWSIEGEFDEKAPTGGGGGYLPAGVGWYRKHFLLASAATGKSVWIEFEGVYQNSDVWINGHHLGHYPNGYMSYCYDLTHFVRTGENILSVRVDNSFQPNSRWYSGSGIYRDVWLHVADPLHVAQWGSYITTPQADKVSAEVDVQTTIDNRGSGGRDAILRVFLTDTSGKELASASTGFRVAAGKEQTVGQTMKVEDPLLWSPEAPHLYTLRTEILEGGRTVDGTKESIGIRTIRYDSDSGLLLNGRRVKMKGVCLHQDGGCVGSAVPAAIWASRLQLLKEMGCNAIRTSHNPESPALLDLCDRMGFLVMDEPFDEWKTGKVRWGYHNYFEAWAQTDLTAFVHRDRDHPSVVMWSAGNEIGEQKQPGGDTVLASLVAIFHREDPTRPVTTANDDIAADGGSARLPFLRLLDIVGYNYMDRWHRRRELYNSEDHQDHPEWKMVGTESVSIPGVRGQPPSVQAVIRAEQLWKYVSLHDYIIGDFLWTGIDYLGEARWPNKNSASGVIDLCGFPKDGYYFYQSRWTEEPMVHICTDWDSTGMEGKVIPVMVFTNCDSVELFLNGKSFGIQCLEFPRPGNSGAWNRYDQRPVGITTGDLHLTWTVPYTAGVLRVVGRKEGKIACEQEVCTPGLPAAIRLVPDRNNILSDGRDVALVKIEVIDKDGNPVASAGNRVEISVDGAGALAGMDNGDPKDHATMRSSGRNVFRGLALGVIRSRASDKDGLIHVRVVSPGLTGAVAEISTKAP